MSKLLQLARTRHKTQTLEYSEIIFAGASAAAGLRRCLRAICVTAKLLHLLMLILFQLFEIYFPLVQRNIIDLKMQQ